MTSCDMTEIELLKARCDDVIEENRKLLAELDKLHLAFGQMAAELAFAARFAKLNSGK